MVSILTPLFYSAIQICYKKWIFWQLGDICWRFKQCCYAFTATVVFLLPARHLLKYIEIYLPKFLNPEICIEIYMQYKCKYV